MTKKLKTALIRVESNFLTGSGHAMRMLALTEMISSKFNLYVASRELSKNLISAFELKGAKYIPLKDISQDNELMHLVAQILEIDLFIIDGYEELDNFKDQCLNTKKKVLLVQDEKEIQFEADMILNHCPAIEKKLPKKHSNRMCFGLEYSILQDCFLTEARNQNRYPKKRNGIFINLGGSDPENLTSEILQIVLEETEENILCVLGPMNKNEDSIKDHFKGYFHRLEIFHDLTSFQIKDLLISAELGICPSSTIALEAIACRLPLVIGWSAKNQMEIYKGLSELGLAKGIGNIEIGLKELPKIVKEFISNQSLKNDMIELQSQHLDGKSSDRIKESIDLLFT